VVNTFTGRVVMSRIVTVSGDALGLVRVTPFSWTILWSFEEMAICANA